MKMANSLKQNNYAMADLIATYQEFNDVLTILPDKTRILLKVFGPLMKTYMKVDMAVKSLTSTFTDNKDIAQEMGQSMEDSADQTEESSERMGVAATLLAGPFMLLGGVVKGVGGFFKMLLMSILPLMGLMMGVVGVVMLLVAAFDTGGGSLRKWLEELPIIGGLMGVIDNAIAAIKETWQTLKDNLTLPEGLDFQSVVDGIVDALTFVVELFMGYWTMITEVIMSFITALAESGFLQSVLDAIVSIYESFADAWDMIMGALGDGGIQNFFDMVVGLFQYLMDFLVNSGIFAFIGDIIGLVGEIVATVVFLAALIISIVIRIVRFVYPYIAPYFKMLIAAFGIILTVFMGIVRTAMKLVTAFVALLRGDFGKVKEILISIGGVWKDVLSGVKAFFKNFINSIIDFVSPALKLLNKVIGVFNKVNPFGDIPKIDIQGLKLAKGGVVSGPKSGYPAELHGTEAVVPLPDGRTIPVTIQSAGDMGGGETTLNINVSGANGDPRKIARMVGEEVGRLFKNRSRQGGFSRGI